MKDDSTLAKLARSNGIRKNKFDYRSKFNVGIPRLGKPSINGLVKGIKRFWLQILIGVGAILILFLLIYFHFLGLLLILVGLILLFIYYPLTTLIIAVSFILTYI